MIPRFQNRAGNWIKAEEAGDSGDEGRVLCAQETSLLLQSDHLKLHKNQNIEEEGTLESFYEPRISWIDKRQKKKKETSY